MRPGYNDYLERAFNIYSNPDNGIWELRMYLNSLVADNEITETEARHIFGTVVDSIDN